MLTKRRIIVGTIVFIFAGLLLFTFANPSKVNEGTEDTNTNVVEQEKEEKNDKIEEKVEKKEEEVKTDVVVNPTSNNNKKTNKTTTTDEKLSLRASKIAKLVTLLTKNKDDYTTDSFKDYASLVNELVKDGKLDVTDLTDKQIDEYINKLEEAINNLVELKLVGLEVSSNNDVYKRLDSIKELTFTAIYNDTLRNNNVDATTTDLFDTSVVAELKTLEFSYNNKYGKASVVYSYSVVKNDRDLLLDEFEELKNKEINEDDYTKESVENLNEVKNTDTTDLDNDELEELIEELKEAYDNLVEVKLVGLEVTPNNDTYKREEKQNKLTFIAIYNDQTKNTEVEATTTDTFDSSEVIEVASMEYSYTEKGETATVDYIYTVVKNRRDLLLDRLEELLNKEINEDDYTTESLNNVEEAKKIDVDNLTDDELESAIDNLEEAINNLEKLVLIGLEVTPNNDSYIRDEKQHELVFTAIFNDELRNKPVTATTTDTFVTNKLGNNKEMTYTYADKKYGEVSTKYIYSVSGNDRDDYLDDLLNKEINEDDYTTESIENLNEAKDVNPEDLTSDELEESIEKLEKAYEELVELKLVGLEITPNNDSYIRDEKQHKLAFTAIFNDESRNKPVTATTTDTFNTNKLGNNKEMTYTYTDEKYGEISAKYIYSVSVNDRDDYLNELLNKEINEDDYTTDSIENLNEAKDVDPEDLTSEELEEAIEKLEKAYEELVELKLVGLEVTPNNDTYTRGTKEQNKLTFTAIFNDESRNKTVSATTTDTFNTSSVDTYAMTYTYTDHGTKTVIYNYTVVKNRRDLLLERLEELLSKVFNKDDYTTITYNNYVEAKNIDVDSLSDDELESAIDNLEEAINSLEKLELVNLTVSSNNDTYERKASQKELTFTAIFNDEARNKNVVPTTNDTFDSSSNGTKSMTYTYTDHGTKTVTYNYTVVRNEDDKVIVGLEAELSQSEFGYKTEVNIKNYLTVKLVAKDGVKEETTDYEVEGFTTAELTSGKELTVSNGEFNDSLTYTVVRTEEGKQLKSIEVKLDSENYDWNSTSYTREVIATDNDGTKYDVTNEVEVLEDFDTTTIGEKEYKVSYTKNEVTKEASTTYTVVRTNAGMVLDHITATLSKDKFERSTTENVKDSLTVTAFDVDGTSYVLNKNEYDTSRFHVSKLGKYTLTISYTKNHVKKTTTVDYEVVKNADDLKIKSVKVTLTKKNYAVNEEIEGLTVEVTYGYGNKEVIDTCTNDFNSATAGYNKTLTVTCDSAKGTATYSVHNDELKGIKATLNRTDGKYSVNSDISVKVEYIDEYNRSTELRARDYSISPALSTSTLGEHKSKITYKTYETTVTYNVSEAYLFDLKIVDHMLVELKESYDEFIDVTKIKVTYTDSETKEFKKSNNEITMISYESKTCDYFGSCVYVKPVYRTDAFDQVDGVYKDVSKIEVFYGKSKEANSLYHSYKLNYTVKNGNITFDGFTDLNTTYHKQ